MNILLPEISTAQSLSQADSLSEIRQYNASNQLYKVFIDANPGRVYDHSSAWLGISKNALKIHDYRESLYANEKSRVIRERLKVEDVSDNYIQNARIYMEIGLWDLALEHLNHAEKLPSVDPLTFAQIAQLQAEAFEGQGLLSQAEHHLQRALDNTIAELGEYHPETIGLLLELGAFHSRYRHFTLADEVLLRARRAASTLTNEVQLQAQLAVAIGELAIDQKKYVAARTWFLQSLDMLETTHPQYDKHLQIPALLGLSRADLAGGEVRESKLHVQKALKILYPENVSDEADIFSLAPNTIPENKLLAAAIWYQAGLCLDPVKSLQLQCFDQALKLQQMQMANFQPAKKRKEIMLAIEQVTGSALDLCFSSADSSLFQEAYTWTEKARNTILLAQTTVPGSDSMLEATHAFGLRQEMNRLDSKTAVYAFFELDKQFYLFAFNSESFSFNRLSTTDHFKGYTAPGMLEKIATFRHAIRSGNTAEILSWGNTFYEWLIQPAESILKGRERLIIVPTETLVQLPFEALSAPNKKASKNMQGKWHKIPWLATRFELSFSLSGGGAAGKSSYFHPPVYVQRALSDLADTNSNILQPAFSREIRQLDLTNKLAVWTMDAPCSYGEGSLSPIFAAFAAGAKGVWTENNPETLGSEWSFSEFLRLWDQRKSAADALRNARLHRIRLKATGAPQHWFNGRIFHN